MADQIRPATIDREWEAVLPDDPRGQPAPYYRALVCLVAHDPYIAVVVKDEGSTDSHQWPDIAKAIAQVPAMRRIINDFLLALGNEYAHEEDRRAPHLADVILEAEALLNPEKQP